MRELPIQTQDPKRRRVLDAAAGHFLAYGFGRTTMDDIARAADMSRPAVYIHFKNKLEIFRELAAGFGARLVEESKEVLAGDDALESRITRMFDRCFICLKEELAESPHGAEMLDMKDEISRELVEECRVMIAAGLADALTREATRNGSDIGARGFTVETLAAIVLDAFDGAKHRGASVAELREISSQIGRLASVATGR